MFPFYRRYPDTKYLVFLAHPVIQSLLLRYMLSISQFSPQFHSYEQQQQPLQCVNKQQYEECIKLLLRAEEWVSWEPPCAEESCSKINEDPPLIHSTIVNCDAIAELVCIYVCMCVACTNTQYCCLLGFSFYCIL